VCKYVCMCIHLYMYAKITHACMYVHVCMYYVYVGMYMYLNMYPRMYACMICMHVSLHA